MNHGKVKFPDGLDDKKGVEQLGRLDDEPGELIPDEVEELRAAVGKTEELGTKKRLSRGNEGIKKSHQTFNSYQNSLDPTNLS